MGCKVMNKFNRVLIIFPPLAVYIPIVIQNQMSFSQFIMLKAFLSATTAGEN